MATNLSSTIDKFVPGVNASKIVVTGKASREASSAAFLTELNTLASLMHENRKEFNITFRLNSQT